MIVQKSYSSPSCTLSVEGLSTEDGTTLTLLTRFICQFHPSAEEISGGKSLLDTLVQGASFYAQHLLAGEEGDYVESNVKFSLQGSHHYVEVRGEEGESWQINLDRVQLFDLVEVLDQLCLDRHTLPELSIILPSITPGKVSTPPWISAVVGISTVAVAGLALWFVPIPKPQPQLTTSPNAAQQKQPKPAPLPTPALITDPAQLEALRSGLFDQIDAAWRVTPTFSIPLTYRVTVDAQGTIVGYKETPATVTALGESAETILRELRNELPLEAFVRKTVNRSPAPVTTGAPQPIAVFWVTFDPITYQLTVDLPPKQP